MNEFSHDVLPPIDEIRRVNANAGRGPRLHALLVALEELHYGDINVDIDADATVLGAIPGIMRAVRYTLTTLQKPAPFAPAELHASSAIACIKMVRQRLNIGLSEAKTYVETHGWEGKRHHENG